MSLWHMKTQFRNQVLLIQHKSCTKIHKQGKDKLQNFPETNHIGYLEMQKFSQSQSSIFKSFLKYMSRILGLHANPSGFNNELKCEFQHQASFIKMVFQSQAIPIQLQM